MTKKILLALTIFGVLSFILINKKQISDREYATQVLNQYIRYYCPRDNTCDRLQALSRLNREWPHVYKLGFSILEENE